MPLNTGTQLGPYRIQAQLGAGGMGEVYRARDDRLGRDIALKCLSPRLTQDPAAVGRFVREARAASALNHPNIVTIHDIGETAAGRVYHHCLELPSDSTTLPSGIMIISLLR